MTKVVLNVEEIEIKRDGDLIVYNKEKDTWVAVSKASYLSDATSQIKQLRKENQDLKKQIMDIRNDISNLAKAIKENI